MNQVTQVIRKIMAQRKGGIDEGKSIRLSEEFWNRFRTEASVYAEGTDFNCGVKLTGINEKGEKEFASSNTSIMYDGCLVIKSDYNDADFERVIIEEFLT